MYALLWATVGAAVVCGGVWLTVHQVNRWFERRWL